MKLIPPKAFWTLFWSGRLTREEKHAILELADERDRLTHAVIELEDERDLALATVDEVVRIHDAEMRKVLAEREELQEALNRDAVPSHSCGPACAASNHAGVRVSGGQPVGRTPESCSGVCPGSCHDGNDSASDKLLNWQVRGLG